MVQARLLKPILLVLGAQLVPTGIVPLTPLIWLHGLVPGPSLLSE